MKKIAILVIVFFIFSACTDNKKVEEKQVEQAIHKIDSISASVKKSTKELEETVKEAKEAIEELENI